MSDELTRTELRRIAEEFKSERDAALRDTLRAFDERNIALSECERLRQELAKRAPQEDGPNTAAHEGSEVRCNDDGTLDEVVGRGIFHLEQMDHGHWWLGFGAGPYLHVHLHARGKITANVIDDRTPAERHPARFDHPVAANTDSAKDDAAASMQTTAQPRGDDAGKVPRQPTTEMMLAGLAVQDREDGQDTAGVWRAMYDVAHEGKDDTGDAA